MTKISVRAFGVEFQNPVMVASGTFGYGDEAGDVMPVSELGALVVKTITLEPRPGNPPPRIAEGSYGMLNSIGLANVGLKVFLEEKLPWILEVKGNSRLIVNIGGRNAQEFGLMAGKLSEQEGIDALEVNVSCPNVEAGGAAFFSEPNELARVVRSSRMGTDRPIIVKLSPNVTNISNLARIAQDEGADALSLINTLNGMLVDIETRKPLLGTVTGGYSGPAILPVGIYNVFRAASAVRIPLIGIGGIRSAQDALQYILAGASLVQVGTANFLNPRTPATIVEGISEYLSRKGIGEFSEIIGTVAI